MSAPASIDTRLITDPDTQVAVSAAAAVSRGRALFRSSLRAGDDATLEALPELLSARAAALGRRPGSADVALPAAAEELRRLAALARDLEPGLAEWRDRARATLSGETALVEVSPHEWPDLACALPVLARRGGAGSAEPGGAATALLELVRRMALQAVQRGTAHQVRLAALAAERGADTLELLGPEMGISRRRCRATADAARMTAEGLRRIAAAALADPAVLEARASLLTGSPRRLDEAAEAPWLQAAALLAGSGAERGRWATLIADQARAVAAAGTTEDMTALAARITASRETLAWVDQVRGEQAPLDLAAERVSAIARALNSLGSLTVDTAAARDQPRGKLTRAEMPGSIRRAQAAVGSAVRLACGRLGDIDGHAVRIELSASLLLAAQQEMSREPADAVLLAELSAAVHNAATAVAAGTALQSGGRRDDGDDETGQQLHALAVAVDWLLTEAEALAEGREPARQALLRAQDLAEADPTSWRRVAQAAATWIDTPLAPPGGTGVTLTDCVALIDGLVVAVTAQVPPDPGRLAALASAAQAMNAAIGHRWTVRPPSDQVAAWTALRRLTTLAEAASSLADAISAGHGRAEAQPAHAPTEFDIVGLPPSRWRVAAVVAALRVGRPTGAAGAGADSVLSPGALGPRLGALIAHAMSSGDPRRLNAAAGAVGAAVDVLNLTVDQLAKPLQEPAVALLRTFYPCRAALHQLARVAPERRRMAAAAAPHLAGRPLDAAHVGGGLRRTAVGIVMNAQTPVEQQFELLREMALSASTSGSGPCLHRASLAIGSAAAHVDAMASLVGVLERAHLADAPATGVIPLGVRTERRSAELEDLELRLLALSDGLDWRWRHRGSVARTLEAATPYLEGTWPIVVARRSEWPTILTAAAVQLDPIESPHPLCDARRLRDLVDDVVVLALEIPDAETAYQAGDAALRGCEAALRARRSLVTGFDLVLVENLVDFVAEARDRLLNRRDGPDMEGGGGNGRDPGPFDPELGPSGPTSSGDRDPAGPRREWMPVSPADRLLGPPNLGAGRLAARAAEAPSPEASPARRPHSVAASRLRRAP